MKTKRVLKKKALWGLGLVTFLILYIIFFMLFKGCSTEKKIEQIEQPESTKSLMDQLREKEKIYISDGVISNVRMEDEKVSEFKYSFKEFSKIRKPESFNPIYQGSTENEINFSTDLDIFRISNINKEEYYKVPITYKKEFKEILDTSIYTSFDFVKQYKTWNKVTIDYGDKNKSIRKWNYSDLASKMVQKRLVGKIQPEKARERSKYKFTINISSDNYNAKIDIMGRDYVKITVNDLISYYEVSDSLYDYIKIEIFKIADEDE